MNYLKRILVYTLPYKKYIVFNILFNILYAAFSALSFVALIPMLEVLFGSTKKTYTIPTYNGIMDLKNYLTDYLNYYMTKYMNENPLISLVIAISLIISIFLLKNVFGYLAFFFINFLRNGVLKDIRDEIYGKIIRLPISYFSDKKKGDTIARVAFDVGEVNNSFLSILELIIKEPLTIIFTLTLMFNLSTKLTIFVIVFIPISGLIISFISKKLSSYSQIVFKEQGNFLSILEETLNGIRIINVFNVQKLFYAKFQKSTQKFLNYSIRLENRQQLASPTSEFLGISVIGILLWYGGKMVLIDQSLAGPVFLSYMALAYNILTPAKAISKSFYAIKKGEAAAERIIEILDKKVKEAPNAIVKTDFNDKILFDKISFDYIKGEKVLNNFTLEVKKGQTVALVGESGSGKTTVINLFNRFYKLEKGNILIDDIPINKMKLSSLRSLYSIVTQDAILFNDSIYNNILIGKESATKEEVIEAAKTANAHEFISGLKEGYDTNIGDGGNKLSGGQKQRLTIARAILKKPPILILDEATSALDTNSEKLVQVALENAMKKRTSIVIAHRLSTIQNADLIIVMQKGEIVEKGSHNTLIKNSTLYKKYVQMQSFNK